jgi:hypothetical protein
VSSIVDQARSQLLEHGMKALLILQNEISKNQKMPEVPPPLDYAYKVASECKDEPGVYFLWHGLSCVYVGMSSNVRQRLMTHVSSSEKFDSWCGKVSVLYMSEMDAR